MAALAAVHSGAGLVTVATDPDNLTALHSHLPEAMGFDLADHEPFVSSSKSRCDSRRTGLKGSKRKPSDLT